jgi:predicted DNA repair protein MutK
MAGVSLLALLDDVTTVLDDVSVLAKMAAQKTVGVVGDDLALTAEQLSGLSAARELPVVWAVAKGSLVNKLIIIPCALVLSAAAPGLVNPVLMVGGSYLCHEGAEKIAENLAERLRRRRVRRDGLPPGRDGGAEGPASPGPAGAGAGVAADSFRQQGVGLSQAPPEARAPGEAAAEALDAAGSPPAAGVSPAEAPEAQSQGADGAGTAPASGIPPAEAPEAQAPGDAEAGHAPAAGSPTAGGAPAAADAVKDPNLRRMLRERLSGEELKAYLMLMEKRKIKGAVRTDLVLSAEIIIIALGSLPAGIGIVERAGALAAVGLVMTFGVYGFVGALVKLDDAGLRLLAKEGRGRLRDLAGRALVGAAPHLVRALGVIGTAAMFLVGGGIMMHGLHLGGEAAWLHGAAGQLAGAACGLVWGFALLAVVRPLAGLLERRRKAGA